MNAFKRYCKNTLGIKPESEYPCMPFEVSPGIVLDSITIDAEEATVTTVYNVLVAIAVKLFTSNLLHFINTIGGEAVAGN